MYRFQTLPDKKVRLFPGASISRKRDSTGAPVPHAFHICDKFKVGLEFQASWILLVNFDIAPLAVFFTSLGILSFKWYTVQ